MIETLPSSDNLAKVEDEVFFHVKTFLDLFMCVISAVVVVVVTVVRSYSKTT
jgi:hypothetical protein